MQICGEAKWQHEIVTSEICMHWHHFRMEERRCLRNAKEKIYREIARLLGRNVSSVSRELRRNCTFFRDIPRYYPHTAQKKSNLRNSYRHRGMFWKQEVLEYIDEKLSQTWSSLDRRKIFAFHPEKPEEKRENP